MSYTLLMNMNTLDAFLLSPLAMVLSAIGATLVLWYFVKHGYGAATDPAKRTPEALFKNFIWGKPGIYVAIGLVPIVLLIAFTWYTWSQI
jgi:hypothetical protein